MKLREALEKLKNLPLGTHFLLYLITHLGGCAIGWIGCQLPGDGLNIPLLRGMLI